MTRFKPHHAFGTKGPEPSIHWSASMTLNVIGNHSALASKVKSVQNKNMAFPVFHVAYIRLSIRYRFGSVS